MTRELLFSVTKDQFDVSAIRGSGPGGQHRNKSYTGQRIVHRASGAVGEATDNRSQVQNKKAAFLRLLETDTWKTWYRVEVARRMGAAPPPELREEDCLVEIKVDGEWVEA